MSNAKKNVYTIPAGAPMASALAQHILDIYGSAEELASLQVFLPTKRACRILGERFLDLRGSKALILPKMHALGDIDEEELSLRHLSASTEHELLSIPPAISNIRRQILLARLICARDDYGQNFEHALKLASALGQLMDHIYTEDLNLQDLHNIVPDGFAQHWQITLNFLKIISEHWPKILNENNMIDSSDRRNRLIKALALYWRDQPPKTPVIAAGSTGSIPATAEFLSCIANMDNGRVVLPGLDLDIDDESWDALKETHPQFGLFKILEKLQISRKDVQAWPGKYKYSDEKIFLAGEIMRPAETNGKWENLKENSAKKTIENALEDLEIIECETLQEEASVISLILRDVLEDPDKTVTLVTADRDLAKRVQDYCLRWSIDIDDSAGYPLSHTALGRYLSAILKVVGSEFSPLYLSSLLKNDYFRVGCETVYKDSTIARLENIAFRGLRPRPGVASLVKRLEQSKSDTAPEEELLESLLEKLHPLMNLQTEQQHFQSYLRAHIACAEALNEQDVHQLDLLWSGDDGIAASSLFSTLFEETRDMPPVSFEEYIHIFQNFMDATLVRRRSGTHPRAQILGQLESRLIDSDVLILGGLNEGTWPRDPGHDPWMSRQMQKQFGLPSSERSIGLSTHDFVQGFCAQKCIITRSKMHGTEPSLPSRWLQRLDKVLNAAFETKPAIMNSPYLNWARAIDRADAYMPCERPAPKPPPKTRPERISATRVETWLKDPYSLYAYSVLRLKPLEEIEKPLDYAAKGTFIHDILHSFISVHKEELPHDASTVLNDIAYRMKEEATDDPTIWENWWPRMESILNQFIDLEEKSRDTDSPLDVETHGEMIVSKGHKPLIVTAKADRINIGTRGIVLIDYKTGTNFTVKAIKTAKSPQLLVEALIVSHGGFAQTKGHALGALEYWLIPGSEEKSTVICIEDDLDSLIEQTNDGLSSLVQAFDNVDTPYYSLPDSTFLPRYNDYEHLARVTEWAVLDSDHNE